MKILFLDQTGKLGGAQFSLLDIAKPYRSSCLVALFENGPFRSLLESNAIPVQVLSNQAIQVYQHSGLIRGLMSLPNILTLARKVADISQEYDLIYANTQKSLIVGAIASLWTQKPLVFHLHDILTKEHFSLINRKISVEFANRFASLVIADSEATKAAYLAEGGRSKIAKTVYYGFEIEPYLNITPNPDQVRASVGLADQFIVGHFSRLSPWKGQHVLIEALQYCPESVVTMLVGDALFGEDDYVTQLHNQVKRLGLQDRVKFLGFRSDVSQLMAACDLVAHTSTLAEPFGRVIVEAMLCNRPVVAAADGGAVEIVTHGQTGWATPPGDAKKLAEVINRCMNDPLGSAEIAHTGHLEAIDRFHIDKTIQEIDRLLAQFTQSKRSLPKFVNTES
jgi:glycosyltransferase involved in cell wall biosynthesis